MSGLQRSRLFRPPKVSIVGGAEIGGPLPVVFGGAPATRASEVRGDLTSEGPGSTPGSSPGSAVGSRGPAWRPGQALRRGAVRCLVIR